MSFGIYIADEAGKEVFALGRKYFKYVGRREYPATTGSSQSAIDTATFTLPASVPSNETPYVSTSAMYPHAHVTLSGRTVTVKFMTWRKNGVWHRGRVVIIYGYYA